MLFSAARIVSWPILSLPASRMVRPSRKPEFPYSGETEASHREWENSSGLLGRRTNNCDRLEHSDPTCGPLFVGSHEPKRTLFGGKRSTVHGICDDHFGINDS